MRLVAVGTGARELWRAALSADPTAVVSQTPEWLDAMCEIGHHEDVTRAYEADHGRCVVLPLARRRTLNVPLPVESSLPVGWGAGGLVGSPPALARDLAGVVADLSSQRSLRTEVRPGVAASAAWDAAAPTAVVRRPMVSQVVDLSPGFGQVWDRFRSRVRRNCRRAERLGLTVESDVTGRLAPAFEGLYRLSVERWARRQHEPLALTRWRARRREPPGKLAAVSRRLGPACRIWLASREGEPAAAIVVLSRGRHSVYWRGAMDDAVARGTGANELLHRLAIERACEEGRREYNMGTSRPASSLAHFKHGFGGVDRPHAAFRFERLALTAAEDAARMAVKRMLRFRDA